MDEQDRPRKDELLTALENKLNAAILCENYELAAELRDKIAARTVELEVSNHLREVTTGGLIAELKRRGLAGVVCIQAANAANKIETMLLHWGDAPSLSGIRNHIQWSLSHDLSNRVKRMRDQTYPRTDWDDPDVGAREGFYL